MPKTALDATGGRPQLCSEMGTKARPDFRMRVLLKLLLSLCVLIAICFAILLSGVGGKKIYFISHGNLITSTTRTPATLVGVFDLYPPYIWWAKEKGLMEAQLWVGEDAREYVVYKIVPSNSDIGIWLNSISGERSGAYVPQANQVLLTGLTSAEPGLRFEGECKPFQPLFLLE